MSGLSIDLSTKGQRCSLYLPTASSCCTSTMSGLSGLGRNKRRQTNTSNGWWGGNLPDADRSNGSNNSNNTPPLTPTTTTAYNSTNNTNNTLPHGLQHNPRVTCPLSAVRS